MRTTSANSWKLINWFFLASLVCFMLFVLMHSAWDIRAASFFFLAAYIAYSVLRSINKFVASVEDRFPDAYRAARTIYTLYPFIVFAMYLLLLVSLHFLAIGGGAR